MGLDVLAVERLPKKGDSFVPVVHDEELEKIDVARGIFTLGVPDTGEKGSGIRGGVYASWVEQMTGYSLYESHDADDVAKIAAGLDAAVQIGVTQEWAPNVAAWFRRCADQGYALFAWS